MEIEDSLMVLNCTGMIFGESVEITLQSTFVT